jgi:hypothetical protein
MTTKPALKKKLKVILHTKEEDENYHKNSEKKKFQL